MVSTYYIEQAIGDLPIATRPTPNYQFNSLEVLNHGALVHRSLYRVSSESAAKYNKSRLLRQTLKRELTDLLDSVDNLADFQLGDLAHRLHK